MSGMLDPTHILEKIIHRFNHSALPKKQLVGVIHEFVLHILFQLRNKLYLPLPQFFKQLRRKIPAVSKQFAVHFSCKTFENFPVPVVHIAGGQAECQNFSPVNDGKVQFEAVKPAGGTLAAFRNTENTRCEWIL